MTAWGKKTLGALAAAAVLVGATVGAVVLSMLAALAVTVGLWPRVSEYR